MGFSDLLTSSRGPGVIGTLLAMLVLVGFGTLYLFVFDEGLQGGQKTIQAVIRDQGTLIGTHKTQIENYKVRIESAKRFKEVAQEADDLKLRADNAAKRLAELGESKKAAEAALAAADEAWSKYRDEYRASEWAAAVGEKFDELKTVGGELFAKVSIRKVTHKGVDIAHENGMKLIPCEDLPLELQDRFQFDKKLTEEDANATNTGVAIHSDNVAIATLAQKAQGKLDRVRELEEQIEASNAAIQAAKMNEVRNQAAVDRMRMAIASEENKRGGISKAPQMKEQLRVMERAAKEIRDSVPVNERKIRDANREISTLKREVETIKADIAKIKKELEAKKVEAPPQP
jgi:chromosome segregation ATPase